MNHLKNTLEFALSLKRPHKGKSVQKLITYLIDLLPAAYVDLYGNVHCTVGNTRTLFSSHTDTVHKDDGINTYIMANEEIRRTGSAPQRRAMYRASGAPLGADCGAGVAIMVHMVMNAIPGHYVFHAAEEVGGIGSTALAKSGVFIGMFDRAIAFDRKATHSIITFQSGGQCCSEEFANALAGQLNDANDSFMFAPDDTGVYTDTAEYTEQIRECTNVSVGYYNEHSASECLDYTFFSQLANAVLLVRWEELPIGVIPPPPPKSKIFNPLNEFNPFSSYDFSEDMLFDLLGEYPDVEQYFEPADVEKAAVVLGEPGVTMLVNSVDGGLFSEHQLKDAIRNPQGYLDSLPENFFSKTDNENFIN